MCGHTYRTTPAASDSNTSPLSVSTLLITQRWVEQTREVQRMATERKGVTFNVDDPLERACWEYARTINFSKWVKDRLKPIVLSLQAQRAQKENRPGEGGQSKA